MTKLLPVAAAAIALSLTSATAFAADHTRDRNHNGPAFSQQQNDHRFDGNNNRNRKFPVVQNQHNNWQPNNNPPKNWQNNNWNNNNWNNSNNWRNNKNWRFNQFAQKRFRVGVYHGPRSFNYHRWSYGDRLPFAYLSSNYWLPNAILYGLFSPPSGLVWVRYGDDALLVDRYTGEIVQVRYNIFY